MLFFALALLSSAILAFGLRPFASAFGLVDEPDGQLKDHSQRTPITGGVAILGAIALASVFSDVFDAPATLVAFALLLLGTYDDVRPTSPVLRLSLIALAGGLLTLSPRISSDPGSVIIAVIFVAVTVTAVNLLDGADGVAPSAAAGSSLGLWAIGGIREVDPLLGLIVFGAIAGFLVVNWPPAKAFLGDGGAYVVGLYLAFLALSAQPTTAPFFEVWLPSFVTAAAMLGVFLVDFALTMWRRLDSKATLTVGDRLHLYDRLRDRGWSARRVAIATGVAQLTIVASVQLLDILLTPWPAALLSVLLLAGVSAVLRVSQYASAERG